MIAALLVLAFSVPCHAGVTASAQTGAEGALPRITLETVLSPAAVQTAGAATGIGLQTSISLAPAPSVITALPASAVPSAVHAAPVTAISAVLTAAAATPESPKANPETAATPADRAQPTFKTRILGMLKTLANPFGGKAAEEAPPANEAERLDREFSRVDLWNKVAPAAKMEIEKIRADELSKAALKEYVQREADAAIERIKAARGVANIGFHYNLHGGRREEYVGAGIRATMGDIALRYSMNADSNYKVYFFQSAQHGGFVPLDSTHGEHIFIKMRMGYVMNLFDLDAPALAAARADGRIKNFGSISMDFHGMKGVPYSAYLAPPVEVFHGTAKKIGLKKLGWDEETLVTIRYLEAAALAGGDFIPR
ncbi:MAG: hypothetical protein HY923_02745 [Elusimicrobia bacterium]|nr:hypothetical protein [Elusimicrobiota bacterium]